MTDHTRMIAPPRMPLLPIERRSSAPGVDPPGFAARRIAADILDGVLRRRRPLDEQLEDRAAHRTGRLGGSRPRRWCAPWSASALRRLGTLRHSSAAISSAAFPPTRRGSKTALLIGAAQILLLEVPDHAAVDLSVRLVQADRRAARYAGLVNAVLRRIARDGAHASAALDTARSTPPIG